MQHSREQCTEKKSVPLNYNIVGVNKKYSSVSNVAILSAIWSEIFNFIPDVVIDDVISIQFFNTVCPDMRFAVANGVRSSPNLHSEANFKQAKSQS